MIAANPGPAVHLAVLGAVIAVALVVYVIVRTRRRHEAAEAERLNQLDEAERSQSTTHRGER
jgi:hypothetical protein